MSERSEILSLPYLQPSQAQKHVTHNTALQTLDALVQLAVLDRDRTEPPALPDPGDRHIVAAGATLDWAGHDGDVAVRRTDAWAFHTPRPGWRAHVLAEALDVVHDGTGWVAGTGPGTLQNVDGVGINSASDATNKLSVAADASLLSHDGAGHQLKINKAAEGDTASLLFQDAWSGRAEMGLAGTDDFAVKVSADGSTWHTGMTFAAATGRPSFPNGGVREVLAAATEWFVDPVLGSDANDGRTAGAGAFATIGKALQTIARLDGNGTEAAIRLADGTHAQSAPLVINGPFVGFTGIAIRGNVTTPSAVTVSGTSGALFSIGPVRVGLSGLTMSCTGSGSLIQQGNRSHVTWSNVVFGASNRFHVENDGGLSEITGSYAITAGAQLHIKCGTGGQVTGSNFTFQLSNTPNFSLEFLLAMDNAVISLWNPAVSGSATGIRYVAVRNGIINTYGKGATFLPGNAAGSVSTGGQYL